MADDNDINVAQDNSQWTTDEDGAICKLKKDGKSWATIAESISRSKSHVRHRFQFIKSQIEAAGFDTDSIGENWAEDMRQRGEDLPSPEKPSSTSDQSPSQGLTPPKSLSPGRVSPAEQPPPPTIPHNFIELTASGNRVQEMANPFEQPAHTRGGRGKKQNEKTISSTGASRPKTGEVRLTGKIVSQNGVRFAELATESSTSSSSSSFSSSSSEDNEEEVDHEAEREEQKRFLYHEYWSGMYPDQKTYEPDRFWSEGDCKVLAVIEAKDAALKYKRLQAEFFNATGRMVSEEVLKYKMQHGK